MDTPATTTNPAPISSSPPTAPSGAPAPKPQRERKALDENARKLVAEKSAARRMIKKLGDAKSVDELWRKADELRGRKVEAGAEPAKVERDPNDLPVAPGWPTPREMAEVQPYVSAAVGMLKSALAETRYNALSVPIVVPGPDNTKISIDRTEFIEKPAIATAALLTGGKLPEIHPGWALLAGVAIAFGPTAVMHGIEWWKNRPKDNGQAVAPTSASAPAPVAKIDARSGNDAKSSGETKSAGKKAAA